MLVFIAHYQWCWCSTDLWSRTTYLANNPFSWAQKPDGDQLHLTCYMQFLYSHIWYAEQIAKLLYWVQEHYLVSQEPNSSCSQAHQNQQTWLAIYKFQTLTSVKYYSLKIENFHAIEQKFRIHRQLGHMVCI